MGKPAGLLFLILGLVLGPGHYIYSRFFTGSLLLEQPLQFSLDADQRPHASARLDLEPAMLPAAVVLQFSASHGPVMSPPDSPQNHYRVRLLREGELVLEKSFGLKSALAEATPGLQFSEAIVLPAGLAEGAYQLVVRQEGEAGMEVTGARWQLRANVGDADESLLAVGFGLIAAGLVMMILSP